ncbi:MAG: aconitase family protein [Gemmatimonadota bacterium]|jgi:3-isopropylmalate/(R)-2-methylmalate dehydratase large subunit
MHPALRNLKVEKQPSELKFGGRVLFLVDDAELIRRQLAGEDLELTDELRAKLRDQISTDEITPAYICYYFDETLGEFPYLGLRAGGEAPMERGSVKKGGFVCSVAGKRRGKGSSREQSPYAEMMAGIRVVLAENIERIYNENCQNLGILTSTDFSLIERIRSGEAIPLSEFTAGVDPITKEIIEYGGLFEYNVARLQGIAPVPPVPSAGASVPGKVSGGPQPDPAAPPGRRGDGETGDASRRPMTIAEKIFARHWVVDAGAGEIGVPSVAPGDSGFFATDYRFSHEYVTPMAAIFFEQKLGPDAKVTDPDSVIMFRDHLTYLHQVMPQERVQLGLLDVARQLKDKQETFAKKQGVQYYGERLGVRLGSEAICHSKMLETYAEPGMLIVGTDSHTPHSGAMGCIAFGVGTTAIFNSWITKDVRVSVPPSFKVVVRGQKPENVTAKDFMLEILRHPYIRDGQAIGQIIEYGGEAVEALSVDERATMTNMAAEVGAFTGIVPPDGKCVDYLVAERGMDRARAESLLEGLTSDPDAEYVKVIEIDASAIRPMVALPGDPGNGLRMTELADDPVKIDVAYAGSCTAGKKEDMDMYARVLKEARDQGLKVHPDVRMYIQCGSQEVKQYCDEQGYLQLFDDIGAEFIEPGCGACIAAGPGTSAGPDEVTISSQNRNFPGRSGPGRLYLASPFAVAASAIAGHVTAWEPGKPLRTPEPAGAGA